MNLDVSQHLACIYDLLNTYNLLHTVISIAEQNKAHDL